MRTTTSAPPRRTRAAAAGTSVRARSFSRRRHAVLQVELDAVGAARVCAFSTYFSTFTGT